MLLPGRSYFVKSRSNSSELFAGTELIDRLWVGGDSLAVKEAREIISQISQQPFGTKRVLVVENADQMSEIIQNTFLKLLEEPPDFLAVVLLGENLDSFLPTVRSRLHPVAVDSIKENNRTFPEFFTDEERAKKVLESTKDRPELIKILEEALPYFRDQLLVEPTDAVAKVELLLSSIRRLRQNANQKLVVDALLLNWPFN